MANRNFLLWVYMVIQGFPCAKHVAGGFRCIATNSPVAPIRAFVTRSAMKDPHYPDRMIPLHGQASSVRRQIGCIGCGHIDSMPQPTIPGRTLPRRSYGGPHVSCDIVREPH